MSEGQKWKDLRRLTLQMFKQFGMANKTISNYITLEVNTLMSCLKVSPFYILIYSKCELNCF